MKICLTTFYTSSYEPLAAITIPVMQKYCDKHKYELNINKIPDGNFHFIKTLDTRALLDKYDVVMGIEADVLITNFETKVEDFLDDEHELYITDDINNINFGVFIAKSTVWAKALFNWVNSQKGIYGDEQNIFEFLRHDKIKICKHPCFNSIAYEYYAPSYGYINWELLNPAPIQPTVAQGDWVKGCFTCHLPGFTMERRIEIFNDLKQYIIYE